MREKIVRRAAQEFKVGKLTFKFRADCGFAARNVL